MIIYKSGQLSKKERAIVSGLLEELTDTYIDFYLTKNNLRLYIKENSELMFEALKNGDKIIYEEELGIIFTTGWSDNFPRKFLKILAKDNHSAGKLVKRMLWELKNTDLYIKIKTNNPIKQILEENGFIFKGYRGKEILLMRIGKKVTIKEK